jgi:hypothetical protein
MAITSILAMAPLFKQKEFPVDRNHVVVDAKIASSALAASRRSRPTSLRGTV